MNYDCDLEFDDLYEALVNVLSRIAQGVHVTNLGLQPAQVRACTVCSTDPVSRSNS